MAVQAFGKVAILVVMSFSIGISPCSAHKRDGTINDTVVSAAAPGGWSPAGATWYGSRSGPGSDGGACGYTSDVEKRPYGSIVAAGCPFLFKSGIGCGGCYEVKCTSHRACSGRPVMVVITDSCLGGACLNERVHFDMSGTAFGAMALPGRANDLLNAGSLSVLYTRVPCNYRGFNIAFRVDAGSNPYYFAVVVEDVAGDGCLSSVGLREAIPGSPWLPMQHSWGAVWKFDCHGRSPLRAPFSIMLTSLESGKTVIADRVIPTGWKPGYTYRSAVNFL